MSNHFACLLYKRFVCKIDNVAVCLYLYGMKADRIYKHLGSRIKALRKALGRTQDQIANQVGMSRASLANIEAGRQKVLVHQLFDFAEALELESPTDLLPPLQSAANRNPAGSDLPLTTEGLTKKQRQEVLKLVGSALSNNNDKHEGSEDV